MAKPQTAQSCRRSAGSAPQPGRHWRTHFIEMLAASSNIAKAAEVAGVSLTRAYRTRRDEPDFAQAWQSALADGYDHLELELVRRLREGDLIAGDGQKFDFASAIRLLAAHRGSGDSGPGRERDVSAAEVRASIDRKIEEIRRRMARKKAAEGSPE